MVALLRAGRRPWVEYAELVEERGSAAAVFEDELEREAAPDGQTSLLDAAPPERRTADEVLDQAAHGSRPLDRGRTCSWSPCSSPDYPPNLRAVHDRPPMVFVAGDLTPADARAIAVVGARKATDAGIEKAGADRQASGRAAGSPSSRGWPPASTRPRTRPRWRVAVEPSR